MDSLDRRLEGHRPELRRHCRRVLGSSFEAEDAVQETLARAWRALDRFDGRSNLRAWLYRIATNVCLNMRRGPQRRAQPIALGPEADGRDAGVAADPAELAASRDAVRRAFLVALQTLPPQQRAVLVLRDVLQWRTAEAAELLGSTEVAVKSALQRARETLAANVDAGRPDLRDPCHDVPRRLLAQCVDALDRVDVRCLVSLLGADQGPRRLPARTTAA